MSKHNIRLEISAIFDFIEYLISNISGVIESFDFRYSSSRYSIESTVPVDGVIA